MITVKVLNNSNIVLTNLWLRDLWSIITPRICFNDVLQNLVLCRIWIISSMWFLVLMGIVNRVVKRFETNSCARDLLIWILSTWILDESLSISMRLWRCKVIHWLMLSCYWASWWIQLVWNVSLLCLHL